MKSAPARKNETTPPQFSFRARDGAEREICQRGAMPCPPTVSDRTKPPPSFMLLCYCAHSFSSKPFSATTTTHSVCFKIPGRNQGLVRTGKQPGNKRQLHRLNSACKKPPLQPPPHNAERQPSNAKRDKIRKYFCPFSEKTSTKHKTS